VAKYTRKATALQLSHKVKKDSYSAAADANLDCAHPHGNNTCLSVCRYPKDAWEMVLGYDQDRFMGGRAGAALVKHIQVAAALKRKAEGNRS
jgi:hypothetical protein